MWDIVVFNLFGVGVSVKNLLGAGVVFLILSILAIVLSVMIVGDLIEGSIIKTFLVGWGFLLLCGIIICIGIGLLYLIGWCFNLIN